MPLPIPPENFIWATELNWPTKQKFVTLKIREKNTTKKPQDYLHLILKLAAELEGVATGHPTLLHQAGKILFSVKLPKKSVYTYIGRKEGFLI